MARRLIFKEGGLTGSLPSGFQAIGFNGATFSQLNSNGIFSSGASGTSGVNGTSGTSAAGGGGLTNFTEAVSTSSPNNTVYVSSVSATGSVTNIDVAIVPKGSGALLADIPDNTATGGNKRGQYAVDWQMVRTNNVGVASGDYSVIVGGQNNLATGPHSVAGGSSCNATGQSSIAFGSINTSSNRGTLAIGEISNATGYASFAAGYSNTASSSGSMAQGYYNVASGGQSIALGYQNTASGGASVAAGYGNTSAGFGSIAIGVSNTTGYDYQFAIGNSNVLSNAGPSGLVQNTFAFGFGNTVNANNAVAIGSYGLINGVTSRQTFSPSRIATNGDSQKSIFFYRGRTTDDTLTTLATDGSNSINASNCMQLSNNSSIRFKGTISGKQSGSTNIAAWDVDGLIVRGSGAAATTLVTSNVTLVSNSPGWGTPVLSAFADAFNGVGALRVQIQGTASTNIQWTGILETTEVIYA